MMLQAVLALAFFSMLLLLLTGISLAVREELPAIRRALGLAPALVPQSRTVRRRRSLPPRAAMFTTAAGRWRAAG